MIRARALAASAVALSTALGATTLGGCDPGCSSDDDCAAGGVCSSEGVCIDEPGASVRFVEPVAGSVVGETFDAVLEVRFRGDTAQLDVERGVLDDNDPCAPFIPRHIVVDGDPTEVLTQQITLPGLQALGERFTIGARLLASGQRSNDVLELQGPALDVGGLTIAAPTLGDADLALNAGEHVTVPVSAVFDGAAERASMFVEVFNESGQRAELTPAAVVGSGVTAFTDAPAPLSRAPQIIWVRLESDNVAPRTCGLGLPTPAAEGDAGRGLELGLSWEGAGPAQLQLRAQAGSGAVCTFLDAGEGCAAVAQSRAPAPTGDEIVRLDATDGVVTVVVAPAAASGPVLARVRVSLNGRHVGWLGPMTLNPGLGEAWVAGRVILTGAVADLQPGTDVVIGAPF